MWVLIKMALRNLFAHKVKTIIIGSLILLGTFVIVIANTFLDSANQGVKNSYSRSITGQVALLKHINFDYSLFGTWADIGNLSMPKLPDYDNTLTFIKNHPQVESWTTVSSGFAVINTGSTTSDYDPWILAMGIDPASYRTMIEVDDTVELLKGSFLQPGEEGIVITDFLAKDLREKRRMNVEPGDRITLNGFSVNGFRIREVTVRGIYRFKYIRGSVMPMIPRTCYIDIDTWRVLNAFTIEGQASQDSPRIDDTALMEESFDELFSDPVETVQASTRVQTDLRTILGDMSLRKAALETDPKAWQWLLIKTKDKSDDAVKRIVAELTGHFDAGMHGFKPAELADLAGIAARITSHPAPVYQSIGKALSQETRAALQQPAAPKTAELLARDLTALIQGPLLYSEAGGESDFEGVYLSPITRGLARSSDQSRDLVRINRLLVEELFPGMITEGPDIMVSEWWHAAAPMSMLIVSVQFILNVVLLIIFVVVAIIIMNTMVISVMERTAEIGTMRAIGAKRKFVFRLFLVESMTIATVFGMAGVLLGLSVIGSAGASGIATPDGSFLQALFGTPVLYPSLSLGPIISALVFIGITGFFSSLYPVHFALKIQPVQAIQTE